MGKPTYLCLTTIRKTLCCFSDIQMLRSIGDLFSAGTETTTTCIRWAVLFFLHNPDVKTRMMTEIDDVVGTSRFPSLNDKQNMPYSEAVITEVTRMANVAPLGVPHSCNRAVEFRGYTIPKGAVLLPNLDSVLFDPAEFSNPDAFDPTRFLNEDGKFCKPERLCAFSVGKSKLYCRWKCPYFPQFTACMVTKAQSAT